MSKKNRAIKIEVSDYARVLATETVPYETPIIFSNDGLHFNCIDTDSECKFLSFIKKSIIKEKKSATIPFRYQIRKNATEYRRLSLLHPASQWQMKEFYQEYDQLILHYCSLSPISIRAPLKIASTYYKKNSWENIHKYKHGGIQEHWTDGVAKHCPSYFSYRGHDRLYKFFDSRGYFNLEKRFSYFLNLDVSKCFDSIYTHTLSWAVKHKEFTKSHVKVTSTFAQQFDSLMQRANHNETNGIVIGPEISRIFSEIIFQSIDITTIENLEKSTCPLKLGADYSIRRYVDDLFIFGHSEESVRLVYEQYAENLAKFNLYPNKSKSSLLTRPFYTAKSRIIHRASNAANDFINTFLEADEESKRRLKPQTVFDVWKLTRKFVASTKSICSENNATYDELSSFLISVFFERIKKLVNVDSPILEKESQKSYKDACLVFLEVLFFLYSVAPAVSSSYKLSTSIIVLTRFSQKNLGEYGATIKQRIIELSEQMLLSQYLNKNSSVERFIPLELLNIALAITELGKEHLLPLSSVEKIFQHKGPLNYFEIISGLYYVSDHPEYESIRKSLIQEASRNLRDLNNISMDAEKACLFLDFLSCPNIEIERKVQVMTNFYKAMKEPTPDHTELQQFFSEKKFPHWFVSWDEIDLLNQLEKKELKQAY